MPQVASSSTKIHTHSHAQGRSARTQQPADPAASAPFASLLDDPAASPAQQQPQQADASKADAASSSQTPKQPAKADGRQDQSTGTPAAGETAVGAPAASGDAALAAAAKAKAAADAAPSAPAAPKDQAKPNASTDQTSDQGPAGPPDPTAVAAAVTPPATPQQPPTPVVAGAVDTAGKALAAPAPQVFIAGAAAQKPEALNDKTKGDPAKQTDATAAVTGAPVNPDDQAVPPPLPQAASAPDTKIVTADRGSAAKPETQEHHAKIDATATLVGSAGGMTPTGGDTGAAGQATVAAAATATAQATGASGTTATSPQAAPAAPQAAAVPLAGLAIEIAGRAQAGKNNFEIRLDPPDLGRIQVKLSVDRQGQVTSHLIADRADTLDLLRRDSSGLERALQDAGLKTAGDGLQFSLRDQSFSGEQNGTARQNVSQVVAQDDILPAVDIAASGYTRYVGRLGGVDIRV